MAKPFIKWIGGKRQLVHEIQPMMPSKFNNYIEPFVGGGALFFKLDMANKSIINDKNKDLIYTYETIRDEPKKLINLLKKHKKNNSKEYFLKLREWDRSNRYETRSKLSRAARLIYMNKTCFNGMYRVNSSGEFNVPYGKYKNPNILDVKNMNSVSKILKKAQIFNEDFAQICNKAKKGDFVYFDPPYVPISKTEAFVSYTADGFGEKQQLELKAEIDKLTKKGVFVLMSNSNSDWIHKHYSKYNIKKIPARRSINSNGAKRTGCKEVIITNYKGDKIHVKT